MFFDLSNLDRSLRACSRHDTVSDLIDRDPDMVIESDACHEPDDRVSRKQGMVGGAGNGTLMQTTLLACLDRSDTCIIIREYQIT